jgi:uncharacterized membrane protein
MDKVAKGFAGFSGVLVFFILVFIGIFFSNADSYSEIDINRYDSTITLDNEGNMHVSETWDMNYNGEYRVRFRDIAYQKFPDNYNFPKGSENTASFDTNSVSVSITKDGLDITNYIGIGYSWENDYDELGELVRCEPNISYCESIFIDTGYSGGLYGDIILEYNYTILGAVSEYSDIAELNWVLLEYAESTIKEGTVTINLPSNTYSTEDLYVFGHGLSDGNLEIIDNDTIEINFSNMKDREFLEFRLLMPTELYPNIADKNVFINDGINKTLILEYEARLANYSNLGIILTQIFLGLAVIITLYLLYMLNKNNKKYFTPHETEFKGDYLRELPDDLTPAEMSYVYYLGKNNDEDITATLLDLIRRKIIKIDYEGQELTSSNADFALTLNEDADVEYLLPHEEHLIKWFFKTIGDGTRVSTKQIENYGNKDLTKAKKFQSEASRFKTQVKLANANVTITDPMLKVYKSKSLKSLTIPIILILAIAFLSFIFKAITTIPLSNTYSFVLLAIVSVIYFIYFTAFKTKRSKESMETFVRWDAFKKFLIDFGNFDDYPIPGVIVWEHYLVYAVSLKCADKVMQQLRVKLPMDEEMASKSTYLGLGYGRRNFYYGAGLFSVNQTLRSARMNAARKISQSSSSSGGRGGGFGGGSSFGGGGGGGRSR